MAISKADLNPMMGIPPLEDGLFANLLDFDYLYYIFLFTLIFLEITKFCKHLCASFLFKVFENFDVHF